MNQPPLRTDTNLALALVKVVEGSGGEASVWVDDSTSRANATFLGTGVPTAFYSVGTCTCSTCPLFPPPVHHSLYI